MKGVRFHDSKLKLVKALLFRSFHETEAPTAGFCSPFICGSSYLKPDNSSFENDIDVCFLLGLIKLWGGHFVKCFGRCESSK